VSPLPQLVAEHENALPIFERNLLDVQYVGETGLDAGPRFYRSIPAQGRLFERILCGRTGQ